MYLRALWFMEMESELLHYIWKYLVFGGLGSKILDDEIGREKLHSAI